MTVEILRAELISGHPDEGPYNADATIAASELNAINRTTNKASLTGSEILQAIDKAEFNVKTDAQQQLVWNILHLGDVNPFGLEADLMMDVFGASTTITALQALRKTDVSRAVELGLGIIRPGNVEEARA